MKSVPCPPRTQKSRSQLERPRFPVGPWGIVWFVGCETTQSAGANCHLLNTGLYALNFKPETRPSTPSTNLNDSLQPEQKLPKAFQTPAYLISNYHPATRCP